MLDTGQRTKFMMLRLMAKFSEHYTPGIEIGKGEGALKSYRNMQILNDNDKVKEGTSRGHTTTNLYNFSPSIFLVPTQNLEHVNSEAPGPKTR